MTTATITETVTVKIVWMPMAADDERGPQSVNLKVEDHNRENDAQLLERLFDNTNLYTGELWDAMQPLPADRPHTALSVGDIVYISRRAYICKPFGWHQIERY